MCSNCLEAISVRFRNTFYNQKWDKPQKNLSRYGKNLSQPLKVQNCVANNRVDRSRHLRITARRTHTNNNCVWLASLHTWPPYCQLCDSYETNTHTHTHFRSIRLHIRIGICIKIVNTFCFKRHCEHQELLDSESSLV